MINKVKVLINKIKFSGVIIAFISFIFIALFSLTELYNTFELRLYDMRFRIKPPVHEWDQLVFLDIDDKSIDEIGKYPWPRHYYADALDELKKVVVKQVTFDIEFMNPSSDQIDTDALNEVRIKAEKKKKISPDDITGIVINNDTIFADSIKNFRKVILPYHFQEEQIKYYDESEEYLAEIQKADKHFREVASIPVPENGKKNFASLADKNINEIVKPIPSIINSAYKFGYTTSAYDSDGVCRKKQLIWYFNDRIYFDLGLTMLMDICNVNKQDIIIKPGESITLKNAFNPLKFVKKDIVIPIDEKGRFYINWAGPGPYDKAFEHIPFSVLLEYSLNKDEIHDVFKVLDPNNKRAKLYDDLDEFFQEYNEATDIEIKRAAWNKISEIRKNIAIVESSYVTEITKELEKEEKEYNRTKKKDLKITVDKYNNFLKGIKIVQLIEGLTGKICLSGLVAIGTQDLGTTPTDNNYYMVGTYHNIVNTILNEAYIIKLNKYINLLLIFIFALLIGIIVHRLGAKVSLIAIVAALIIVNIINIGLFIFFDVWLDQLGTNLAVFIPSGIIAGMKLMKEESQKRYIKSAFSRYLAPAVIEKIIDSPKALELGGEEQNISIFFSDIQKFSTISEKLTPPELVALLNEYLSEMTNIILSHGGTVDKYIGDAIMAFYGAPLSYEDHARRCCFAAIDMKKRLRELQDHWRESGSDILKVRMGMNSGKAVVGNMGSSTQMGYTAMGDAVNLASRLEGVNKAYSTYAMISESTYQYVKDEIDVRKLDTVRVVGKEEPIVIYELLGEKGKLPDRMYSMLEKYYKALEAFGNRDWKGAISYFQQGLKIVNDDGPSLMYIERCEKYLRRAPSKDWDGVYKLTSK